MSDFEIIQRRADSLRFVDVGLYARWDGHTEWCEVTWIAFDGIYVELGARLDGVSEPDWFSVDPGTLLDTVALIPQEVTA